MLPPSKHTQAPSLLAVRRSMLLGRPRLRIVVCCFAILTFLLQHQPVASFLARAGGLQRRALTMSSTLRGDDGRAILLLSTTEDKASVNLVNALLQRGGWDPHDVAGIAEGRVWRRPGASVYLWQIEQGFLRADALDRRWTTATSQPLQGASLSLSLLKG